MLPKQSNKVHFERSAREILITPHLFAVIQTANPDEWESLFQEFRLHLHGRMASMANDHDLHKLQGKVEMIDELYQFFEKILHPQQK